MKTRILLILFAFLAVPLCADENASEKHLLRYRFHKGQTLRWSVRQTVKLTTSIGGNVDIVESTSRSTKLWTLNDLTDTGTATFEYMVENVRMRQSRIVGSNVKIDEYDSTKDEHVPGAFITLEGTIGVPLAKITVDPQGKTTKRPLREYRDSENTENRIVVPVPKESVAVGDHWDDFQYIDIQKPDGTIRKIKLCRRYTLKSLRSDLAIIDYTTEPHSILSAKERYGILDKFVKGRIEIDLDAGHFVRQEIEVDESVVGFQGANDSVHHVTRLTECSCGLKSCEVCSPK